MERSAVHMWNSTGQAFGVWYCKFHVTLWALMAADLSLWDWAVCTSIQEVKTISTKLWCYVWFSMFRWVVPLGCWFIPLSSACCYVFLEWLVVISFFCIVSGWGLFFSLHYFYKNDMQTIKIKIKPYIIIYMCAYLCIHRYIINWWAQCVV